MPPPPACRPFRPLRAAGGSLDAQPAPPKPLNSELEALRRLAAPLLVMADPRLGWSEPERVAVSETRLLHSHARSTPLTACEASLWWSLSGAHCQRVTGAQPRLHSEAQLVVLWRSANDI
jgi:hypothetical protein